MKNISNSKLANTQGEFIRPYPAALDKDGNPIPVQHVNLPGWGRPPRVLTFVLNVLNANWKIVRANSQFFFLMSSQVNTPGTDRMRKTVEMYPNLFETAVAQMVKTMRTLADLWIDSGKTATNLSADAPRERNAEIIPPGHTTSLFRAMRHYFLRFPPEMRMRHDGTQGISLKVWPRFQDESASGISLMDALERYGADLASYHFSNLLDTTDRYRLTRCDGCSSYFSYARARLRTVKHGVFCPKCETKGSVKRTERSREIRLETAAMAWIAWEAKGKGQPEPQRIADKVNERHGTAFGKRWVSQNLTKIQQRVEALRNAKG